MLINEEMSEESTTSELERHAFKDSFRLFPPFKGTIGMCTQCGPKGALQQAARLCPMPIIFKIQNMHCPTMFRSHSLSKSREAFDFFSVQVALIQTPNLS